MRRPAAALTALALTLALAGCGAEAEDGSATPAPTSTDATSEADVAALAAVEVAGEIGAEPTVTFDQPFAVTAPVAREDVAGDGDALAADALVNVDYVALSGDDASVLGSTWQDGAPIALSMSDSTIYPALVEVLATSQIGARVLLALPGSAATEEIEATPAVLMIIEVVSVLPNRAEGTAVTPAPGLPLVTLAENGAPSIAIPADTAQPSTLVVQPLITGTGPVVEAGQVLTVQYTGWTFDGTVFDSSWEGGSAFQTAIGTNAVITGWDQGLVGQPVGSQVLLVIPPDLAYGGTESELAEETLIFVVDILAAS